MADGAEGAVSDAFTRKIGPLKAWQYGAAIVAIVWAYYLYSKKFGKAAATNPNASILDDLGIGTSSPDLSGHIADTGLDDPPDIGAGTGGETASPTGKPKTNEEWISRALQLLTSAYGMDNEAAGTAVQKYLSGKTLTATEWALIKLVEGQIGKPPQGVVIASGTGSTPTPVPTGSTGGSTKPTGTAKPTPAPTGIYVTVTKWPSQLGTLWGIAETYLGNGALWTTIWNAPQNATLKAKRGAPEHIQTGDKFYVPNGKAPKAVSASGPAPSLGRVQG